MKLYAFRWAMACLAVVLMAIVYFAKFAPNAEAHTGNISVTTAVCAGSDSMVATYEPVWSNGTSHGVLSWKPGLVNSPGTWTQIGSVSGPSGSSEFSLTHSKSDFSGQFSENGPWISFRIVFDDNYTVKGDTRVEGFAWGTCFVPPPKPDDKVEITYGDWTGPELSCDLPTAKWTRTVTQTTTPYVWDATSSSWISGTPTIVQLESEERTAVWPGDLADCTPKPEPYTWTENRLSCEDGIEVRQGTQDYVFDHQDTQTWVLDESTTTYTDWTRVSDLPADVALEMGCVIPVVDNPQNPEDNPVPPAEVTPSETPSPVSDEVPPPVQSLQTQPVLASTGVSATQGLIIAMLLILAGCGVLVLGTRWHKKGTHRP